MLYFLKKNHRGMILFTKYLHSTTFRSFRYDSRHLWFFDRETILFTIYTSRRSIHLNIIAIFDSSVDSIGKTHECFPFNAINISLLCFARKRYIRKKKKKKKKKKAWNTLLSHKILLSVSLHRTSNETGNRFAPTWLTIPRWGFGILIEVRWFVSILWIGRQYDWFFIFKRGMRITFEQSKELGDRCS